jgi:hypothetical protein
VVAFLMTLTAALGVLAMGGITATFSTYDSAMLLVVLGSLIAVGAIVSLEVFVPARRPEARVDTMVQQKQSAS